MGLFEVVTLTWACASVARAVSAMVLHTLFLNRLTSETADRENLVEAKKAESFIIHRAIVRVWVSQLIPPVIENPTTEIN